MFVNLNRPDVLLFDIETTRIEEDFGRFRVPAKVHLLLTSTEDGHERAYGPDYDDIRTGVAYLQSAKTIVAHFGHSFDIPVLKHHFGLDVSHIEALDSLILARLFYSGIKEEYDFAAYEKGLKMPKGHPSRFTGDLIGKHSLEAWGMRLDFPKGTYAEDMKRKGLDPWAQYNPDMRAYGLRDVAVLRAFWLEKLKPRIESDTHRMVEHRARVKHQTGKDVSRGMSSPKNMIAIEHYVQGLMDRAKQTGIFFDKPRALALVKDIKSRVAPLEAIIAKEFPTRLEPVKWTRNRLSSMAGYTDNQKMFPQNDLLFPQRGLDDESKREMWGAETRYKRPYKAKDGHTYPAYDPVSGEGAFVKCAQIPFNPGSRPQVVRRLQEFGWQPDELTDAGAPSVSEVELLKAEERFPQAKNLIEYALIGKRLGQIATGRVGWLKLLDENNYIHPTIIACSTVTFRATHSAPNISQVPAVKTNKDKQVLKGREGKWGWDCRACFRVPPGWMMIGTDLKGIELRCWANRMVPFDGGRLVRLLLEQDVHEEFRKILGLTERVTAKRFVFGTLYGAGDEQAGFIINPTAPSHVQRAVGRTAKARFLSGVEGFAPFSDHVGQMARQKKYVVGLDGRRCPVRKEHAAINTQLQGDGAVISKYWIREIMRILEVEKKLRWGYDGDFTLLLYSHDELQWGCRAELEPIVKDACEVAALRTGEILGMKIPIESEVKPGQHWGDCH